MSVAAAVLLFYAEGQKKPSSNSIKSTASTSGGDLGIALYLPYSMIWTGSLSTLICLDFPFLMIPNLFDQTEEVSKLKLHQ
jgi:hypothetical protein